MPGHPFPPPSPFGPWFPGFAGTTGDSDSCPAVPDRFSSQSGTPRCRGERCRSPRFLEDPIADMPCSWTPEKPRVLSYWTPSIAFRNKYEDPVGLLASLFRGWITRPARSLSTLRSLGHPRTTQDSLDLRVPLRTFSLTFLVHDFLLPGFPGATSARFRATLSPARRS